MTAYRVMLVLSSRVNLNNWIAFAARLLPPDGEIHLRGMVTVEEEKSLSEGAIPAREWRDAFRAVALAHPAIHDEVQVYVDYQPFQRIVSEIEPQAINLLLIEWSAFTDRVGGVPLDQVLNLPLCDVALVIGMPVMRESHQVLLSLRGGPNLTLGTRIATAITGGGSLTLFHAVPRGRAAPDLEAIMRTVPQITRTVTMVSGAVDGIVREAAAHDLIVMGAGFHKFGSGTPTRPSIFHDVFVRTGKPLVLVHAARPEPIEFHTPRFTPRSEESLSVRVDRWFAENTFHSSEFGDLRALMAMKERQGVTISVALPALNEEETVEQVITTIKTALMEEVPLIDELVLIDSNSTDRTRDIAAACGIPTVIHQQVLVDTVGSYSGKGEALWKSLHVTHGDIIAWVDTDINNIHPRFIYGLLGPLLRYPRLQYVKGFYARPLEIGGTVQAYGGGRVTELVARPFFNLFYPELSGIIQPLAGEYAGRRSALEQVPFFTGYGVETGLLIDLLDRYGLESIAQSDLEVRIHHNQPLVNLSKMSFAILQVFLARLESRYGAGLLSHANRSMKLVIQEADRFALDIAEVGDHERTPMITVPGYGQNRKTPAPRMG